MRLQDIMRTRVEVIGAGEPLERARTQMDLRRIHHLVVVADRRVIGIVTADGIERGAAAGVSTVADVMIRDVVTAPPELTVRKAANLMRGRAVGALPILAKHRLVGIVTVSDLLELLGSGAERPVAKSRRWTLRHRGIKPQARPRAGQKSGKPLNGR